MRIIAGKYKRKQILFPGHIRPTQDKVRQAVFDCMAGLVEGTWVLDLFAGSGAYGLESLSRGAIHVYFIDSDRKCTTFIERNLEVFGLRPELNPVCARGRKPAGRFDGIPSDAGFRCKDKEALNSLNAPAAQIDVFNYTNDAFRAVGILEKKEVFFDLIFVDPPYRQELAKKALQTLSTGGILSHLGFVIIEHSKKETLSDTQGSLNLVKRITHSDTVVSIYQRG
jgi:16S rRNA (guanine966-N2)-methyltransferase